MEPVKPFLSREHTSNTRTHIYTKAVSNCFTSAKVKKWTSVTHPSLICQPLGLFHIDAVTYNKVISEKSLQDSELSWSKGTIINNPICCIICCTMSILKLYVMVQNCNISNEQGS